MYYYEVWVSGAQFHGNEPLTYQSEERLKVGSIVLVPLQRRRNLGIIYRSVPKPQFSTKPVVKVVTETNLPASSMALFAWLQHYYPAPTGTLLSLFMPSGLTQTSRTKQITKARTAAAEVLPPLTTEQKEALQTIRGASSHTVMLHGDTGTGKTRVYLELCKETLDQGKSATVLTPEIGLTPQLAQSFQQAFPGRVEILHSTLTPAARRDAWLRVLTAQQPIIVIGPRSAIFSPVHNLGLIVIDECHDSAYKQESAPYYQTTRVAAKLAELEQAKLILGSATPLVGDYYALANKQLPIVRMSQAAVISEHPPVDIDIVDFRNRDHFTRSSWLSTQLIEGVATALTQGGQSLIFLNRRGTARLVLCHDCGWQAVCPRCDLPLTYHGDSHTLRCHTCGFRESTPAACPICRSADIIFKSIGTKTLVIELQHLFPKAKIMRFDSDAKKSERLEANYTDVHSGKVDILVGTQMLSKGLDLPNLELLGIVLADTSLSFPDYTAEERTFQMLTQVLGRVGRGHRQGHVIIQSHNPDNPVLVAAIERNYEDFYQTQIKERQTFNFPPFCYILKLTCSRASKASAQKAATTLAEKLSMTDLAIHVTGPSPAFIEKNNNKYVWQIIVRAQNRSELVKVVKLLPANWIHDLDPSNLL
jgi:primosomal protein N' (replication factor Y) (superfamily II helicase)